ncbi:hypothetical protein [Pararhodobacter sp.]|uniref:hypothetical protein n=1 Tax=Pararhodobacter sp. TaxID=2127056 RepID=UPI002FDCAE3E
MDVKLTLAWKPVAEGEGPATFEALNPNVRWWVASEAPTTTGLTAEPGKPISVALDTDEILYLSGAGTAVVLAENPIV